MRFFHRGAYEHLWAEQKFAVIAVSWESYRRLGKRFNPRRPNVLTFLRQLVQVLSQPSPEPENAFLHAYSLLKNHLDRRDRQAIVEGLLRDDPEIRDFFYRNTVAARETFLYGCRIFFPSAARNKFWDFDDAAGLWVCLGPFLSLVTPADILARLRAASGFSAIEINELLKNFQRGIPLSEYDRLPESFCMALERHCMVAKPGNRAFLHPRVPLPLPVSENLEKSAEENALKALEECWDECPSTVPELPDRKEWAKKISPDGINLVQIRGCYDSDELWETIQRGFQEQFCAENSSQVADAEKGEPENGEDEPLEDTEFDE